MKITLRSAPAVIAALFALPSSAHADCYTTGTDQVRRKCQKEFLLQSDQFLNEYYTDLIKLTRGEERKETRLEQRQWLNDRNKTCHLDPIEASQPDWAAAILTNNEKAECVTSETIKRASFLSFEVGQHRGHPVVLPHSDDALMYTWLEPNTTLDAYLGALRKNYDLYDDNHDGVISMADLSTGKLSNQTLEQYLGQGVQAGHPLTWETVAAKGKAYFQHFDKNNDGFVSADEFSLVKEFEISLELGGYRDVHFEKDYKEAGCRLPTPAPNTDILLLSAYEAKALASVGMHGTEARAGLIKVSPGNKPLYVILTTFRPTIWQFEGDVSRLQTVVITSMDTGPNSADSSDGVPLGGAIGLKKSQVFFPAYVSCMAAFWTHPSRDSILRIDTIKDQFGRFPDVVATDYGVVGFSLPEGAVIKPKHDDATGWQTLRAQVGLFYPGGVVPMNADQIISSQPVKTHIVLPGVAGLRQLVEQGALVALPGFHTFRVTRAIELPDGLYGAALAVFVLPTGVPFPKGDLGHSCVKAESDGKALAGHCPF